MEMLGDIHHIKVYPLLESNSGVVIQTAHIGGEIIEEIVVVIDKTGKISIIREKEYGRLKVEYRDTNKELEVNND